MRAIFLEDINNLQAVEGDAAHHLINVVRIQKGEEILLLNGMGTRILVKVVGLVYHIHKRVRTIHQKPIVK